jgi:predicted anti-sigma-YlaC factor YlaD
MCPDRQILSAWFDGEIGARWDRAVADHVAGCGSCRARLAALESTRHALSAAAEDWQVPMERVRRRILIEPFLPEARPPAWRRQVALPLPVALFAAALVLCMGITLAVVLARTSMGYIRVTRAPAGGTEYQFAVPYEKVEQLLKTLGGAQASAESVMTLPKHVKLFPVGEPLMGKADEFSRVKP